MTKKQTLSRAELTTESEKNCYMKCPSCGNAVLYDQVTQDGFQAGGIGHKCPTCSAYIGIFRGSCCGTLHIIDHERWNLINQEYPISCVNCSEPLLRKKDGGERLVSSFIEKDLLHPYTTNQNEADYIANARSQLKPETQELLAIYHQSTYERMCLAKDQLSKLIESELTTSFVLSNNKNLTDTGALELKNNSLQQSIYIVVISLFSAIESLAQEINVFCSLDFKERKVDYKLFGNIPSRFPELSDVCKKVSENQIFKYLRGLRNILAHRKVVLMAIDAIYDLPEFMPITPRNVIAYAMFYLPDDPEVEIGSETYNDKNEVKATLRRMMNEIESVLSDIHYYLSKINSNC